jgi:hypothetical protein
MDLDIVIQLGDRSGGGAAAEKDGQSVVIPDMLAALGLDSTVVERELGSPRLAVVKVDKSALKGLSATAVP